MEKLQLTPTFETPRINFDPELGLFEIEGRSIPEDPLKFFKILTDWLDSYSPNKNEKIKLIIYLFYYNTSSSKNLLAILNKFDTYHKNGCNVKVIWKYDEDDEDSLEDGKDLGERLKLDFELEEVKS